MNANHSTVEYFVFRAVEVASENATLQSA